jgi:succinate dehydrogenase / fumarate reductase iron-sulfur subunit
MKLFFRIWRQHDADAVGSFARYALDGLSSDMTLLEALDRLNERLVAQGEPPVAFDSDCREGICGACGIVVNGRPHGPLPGTTTCLLPLRVFRDGATVVLEPFRTGTFPVVRDLVVDRSALDRIVRAGGYVSVRAGSAPEAHTLPIERESAERSLDAAQCIGCGACVAACPNASATLFMSAKVGHLGLLPHGQAERWRRVRNMTAQHDAEGFGHCSNHGECEAVCPKGISLNFISLLNSDLRSSVFRG